MERFANAQDFVQLLVNELPSHQLNNRKNQIRRAKLYQALKYLGGWSATRFAWAILRKGSLRRIFSQDNHDKLLFYYVAGKKRKKTHDHRAIVLLPDVHHCVCKQYRLNFKRKLYATMCSHLLAIMIAKKLDWWPDKSWYANELGVKKILKRRMKNFPFTTGSLYKCVNTKPKWNKKSIRENNALDF